MHTEQALFKPIWETGSASHALQKGVVLPLMTTKMGSFKRHQKTFI